MPTTGQYLYQQFANRADQAYSDYTPEDIYNIFAKEALLMCIEKRLEMYKKGGNLDRQKARADLFTIIKADVLFTCTNNEVDINGTDFMNEFSVKCNFIKPYVSIISASNTSPIKLTLTDRTNLRSGTYIQLAGVSGNTAANGLFYLKQLNDFQFSMYTDINLTNPSSGNGAYVSGGQISKVIQTVAYSLDANQKSDILSQATISEPRYLIADGAFKMYPLTENCASIYLDYASNPVVFIDATYNTIDLELTYTVNFLNMVNNQIGELVKQSEKDPEMVNSFREQLNQP